MAKTLILIRHGKALPRETWKEEDAARPLSGGGELSLEARLPHVLSLIDKGMTSGGVEVWSSPAVRTMQTACIAAHILDADAPKEQECLLTQDADAFLRLFEESDASCVVAVGHNPFVDDVAARLSGVRLPFFTGAAVALRVERGAAQSTRPSARLLWFVQGPKASRWATLAAIQSVIARSHDAVTARMLAFFEHPEDPETMHKFRVSIRTMRSLVAFAEPFMKRSQAKAMQRNLRTVVRWTSRLRELDVLHDQAASMEAPCAELADAIAKARDAERERVTKQLKSKKAAKLLAAVGEEAMHVAWKPQAACEGVSRKAMRARFASMLAELERDLEALDISDAEATHDVRKEAKRVRYSAENFREFLEDDAVAVAKRMVKMQDGFLKSSMPSPRRSFPMMHASPLTRCAQATPSSCAAPLKGRRARTLLLTRSSKIRSRSTLPKVSPPQPQRLNLSRLQLRRRVSHARRRRNRHQIHLRLYWSIHCIYKRNPS